MSAKVARIGGKRTVKDELENDDMKWVGIFFVTSLLHSMAFATASTAFGPAQPYIAKNIGMEIDSINLVHTFAHFTGLIGSILSAMTFKKYVTRPFWKLSIFGIGGLFASAMTFMIPLAKSFTGLVLIVMFRDLISGYSGTGAGGMLVYTIGPIKSRHMIMASHFAVGIGFLIGPFLLGHYFKNHQNIPVQEGICHHSSMTTNASSPIQTNQTGTDDVDIITPFHLATTAMAASSLLYFLMIFLPYKMPIHESFEREQSRKSSNSHGEFNNRSSNAFSFIVLSIFYFSSCGSERVFQSMGFTFGLCGPLSLAPSEAVITDKMYNFGFMTGRFLSIFFVNFALSPKWMLRISLFLTLIASFFLDLTADISAHYLYIWSLLVGLALSWQFGSMYSWCAEHIDIVGWRAALFSIGCGTGGALVPPSAGYLFTSVSPMAVWYLNSFLTLLQVTTTIAITVFFNHANVEPSIRYSSLTQDDDQESLLAMEELDQKD